MFFRWRRDVCGGRLRFRRRLGGVRRGRFRGRLHGGFGYRGRGGVEVLLPSLRLRLRTIRSRLGDGCLLHVFRHRVGHIVAIVAAELDRHILVNGAGVRLLFGDAEFGKQLQDFVSFDFQLARQLVDTNLSHRQQSA
jgi:hypothetical protein